MIVGFDKANKDIFIIASSIALLNILYCIFVFIAITNTHPPITLTHLTGIAGSALSVLYMFLVERFLNRRLPLMTLLKFAAGVLGVFLIIDLTQGIFTEDYWYLTEGQRYVNNDVVRKTLGNFHMSKLGEILASISMFSTLVSLIYIRFGYSKQLKTERLLEFGIYLSFIAILNDILVAIFDFKHAIPLLFIGYLFECIRLSMYFYDYYKTERELILSHMKSTTDINFASDYTRILIHDLRGLIRRNKESLDEEFLQSLDTLLKMYSHEKSQKTSLKSTIQTVIILFEANNIDKKVNLKKSLHELEHINKDLNINSSIVCSIIYGLLVNALEETEKSNESYEIELIAKRKPETIKFQVINHAPNITFDEDSNFPTKDKFEKDRGNGLELMRNLARSQFLELTPRYEDGKLTMELLVPL